VIEPSGDGIIQAQQISDALHILGSVVKVACMKTLAAKS